jgi:hypothetical protein
VRAGKERGVLVLALGIERMGSREGKNVGSASAVIGKDLEDWK